MSIVNQLPRIAKVSGYVPVTTRMGIGFPAIGQLRLFTDVSKSKRNLPNDPLWDTAKPYHKIPGPSRLEFLISFLPKQKFHRVPITSLIRKLHATYGSLVRVPGLFGKPDILFTFEADDVEKVYRNEDVQPIRMSNDTMVYHRKKLRPDVYGYTKGLVGEQGDNWQMMRNIVNPVMLKPEVVQSYIPQVDRVSKQFVKLMRVIRDENMEMPSDFTDFIKRYALESTSLMALDKQIGLLEDPVNVDPKAKKLIQLIRDSFYLSYQLDFEPSIWKYVSTPKYKKVMKIYDGITDIVKQYVDEAVERIESKKNSVVPSAGPQSVFEKLMKVKKEVATVMAIDNLFGGVDTVSATAVCTLFLLATNPDKQQILRDEIMKILQTKDSDLNEKSLEQMPYMRACIKESMRMCPVIPGNSRFSGRNMVLQGYRIPKGKNIFIATNAHLMNDEYFERATEFIPERWLKNMKDCPVQSAQDLHKFLFLPFGYGVRTCIGRRFATMQIEILIARILREFVLNWKYGPLEFIDGTINFPRNAMTFTVTDVKEKQ